MPTIVKFNRKFTQAQLDNARGTSTINDGTTNHSVVDGSWYIAKQNPLSLFVGSKEGGATAVLVKVADLFGGDSGGISSLDSIVSKSASGATDAATNRSSSVQVVTGIKIEEIDGKLVAASSSVNSALVDMAGAANKAYEDAKQYTDNQISSSATTYISGLSSSITKSASGATTAASSVTDYAQVVGGVTIIEKDGKLSDSSSVTAVRVDKAGAANIALSSSKAYTDEKISSSIQGLGTIMHFEGTKTNESDIKALTNVKKGDVYINSADHSEWVATADIGATADATKWEKFGTTDVNGALYKGSNTLTSGSVVIADGTDGKVKTATIDSLVSGGYKKLQTAVTDSGTGYVSAVTQNTQGVITVTKTALPSGTGSVGSASTATDAWKTVVHNVSLSGHTLSGATKSIPAASTGSDGYMPSASFIKLNGIAAGAEVNQKAWSTIKIGDTIISSSTKTDQFEIKAGDYISLTPSGSQIKIDSNAVTGSISGSSWKNPVQYIKGTGHGISGATVAIPAAATNSDGYMSSASYINLNTAITALTWEE